MTVNNGTSSGSIPSGTAFSGELLFEQSQTAIPVAFGGGTKTTYTFVNMSLTVGTTTVSWGPGAIDVYDNLTSTSSGYPTGDSVYVNLSSRIAPSGPINGAMFNYIFLGLVDSTGTAVSAGALPSLDFSRYQRPFIEFNYGTLGTPYGAGNTSTIQWLTTLSNGSAPAISFAPTLPNGTVNAAYSATFNAATGGTGSFTYSASGLPAGLSLAGTIVSGTPTTAGSYNVTLTATDGSNASVSVVVPVVIAPAATEVCSGNNAVISAYVARNPGYIVVNGGLNLLDHLWTSNLNAGNTTFLGGLVNWYQTGLIVSYTGIVDPNGCILDHLTVWPAVKIATTTLPGGTVGLDYSAPVAAAWGVAPYRLTVQGLPAGLSFDGTNIRGVPTAAGTYPVTVSATDSVGAVANAQLTLTIGPSPYTVKDDGKGKITAIDPNYQWVMVGSKKLIWNSTTTIIVNTPSGELHVVTSFVKVGMKVQWKGLRDNSTNTVMTSLLEIN